MVVKLINLEKIPIDSSKISIGSSMHCGTRFRGVAKYDGLNVAKQRR